MLARWIGKSLFLVISFFAIAGMALGQQQTLLTARNDSTVKNAAASNFAANNGPLGGGTVPVSPFATTTKPRMPERHKFWDRDNTILFTGTAALATADFFVTRSNLKNGGRELNPLVRPFTGSTPLLAMNFAGETAGVMGISYFFHQTGHHKLERLTSMVSISASGFAVSYGLTHR